jgi:hypothetical protein
MLKAQAIKQRIDSDAEKKKLLVEKAEESQKLQKAQKRLKAFEA